MSLKLTLVALGALLPLAACSSAPTARRFDDFLAGRPKKTEIEVHGDVSKACNVYADKAYFEPNSDGLDKDDQVVVEQIGECMLRGPLSGRSILITGYADKEGTKDYNQELGMERARAIAVALTKLSISPERIYLRSRGERAAKGKTEIGMAYDRKVELDVVQRYR